MSNINRTITISGQDNGFSRVVDNLGNQLSRAFEDANQEIERLTGNTTDFAEVVRNRMTALDTSVASVFQNMVQRSNEQNVSINTRIANITKELSIAEKQLKIDTERARLSEKQRFRGAVSDAKDGGASKEQMASLVDEHRRNMTAIEEDQRTRALQLQGVRGLANEHIGGLREQDREERDEQKAKDEEERDKRRKQSSGNSAAGSMAGDAGRALLSGFGVLSLLSVSGFIGKMIQEGIQLDEAQSSTRGLGMSNVSGGAQYGKKQSEMLGYARNVAVAAGDAKYNATGNLAFEKRFSQDENSLLGLTKALRTEGSGRGASRVAIEMMNFFRRSDLFNVRRGDFTQIAEKIQFSTQMLEQQAAQMHKTNATTNATTIPTPIFAT